MTPEQMRIWEYMAKRNIELATNHVRLAIECDDNAQHWSNRIPQYEQDWRNEATKARMCVDIYNEIASFCRSKIDNHVKL